jgi:protocatechuate 3,4-dioxygenase beta subunit
MDQSPSRSTGKDTLSAGYRYKAVIVVTLAVAAVAYFAYLQPRIQSSPGAARDTNIDCNVGIQAADLGPDCPPLPAVAAATKPETANEWQPDPEEPAVTRGPAVGEISSDRTGTVKTSAWHTANDAFDQTDNRPRAGYTMAELCAAVGNASSQLHCEPIDSSRLVKSRNSRSIDSDLETYSISGHVITAAGEALRNVTVVASAERMNDWEKSAESETLRFWTRTDSLGGYSFDGLPEGEYSIRVSSQPPYRAARIIARSGVDYADLVVRQNAALIVAGTVVAEDGQPLEGVTVLPVLLGQASVLTDDGGRFELPVSMDPELRSVALRFQRPGYREATRKAPVQPLNRATPMLAQSAEIKQVMMPVDIWTSLRGTVTDTAGKPMPGRSIELRPLSAKQTYRTTTDREGQFKFPVLEAPADYRLLVTGGPGYKDFQRPVRLTADNPELPVVIAAYEFGKISGRLVNTNGEPVTDFDLVLRNSASLKPNAVVRTDKNGDFAIEAAPAGELVLASQSVPSMLVKGLHLDPGESMHLPLLLDWGVHEIRGTVVDASNNPVPASRVVLQWSHETDGITTNATRRTAADTRGNFAFSNLGPGPHLLRVDAPGHPAAAINYDLSRQGYEVTVRLN